MRRAMHASARPGVPLPPPQNFAPGSTPPDPARLAAVNDQIDYCVGLSQIPPSGISRLHSDIARLDESGRRQMLGKLARALNTRDVWGQL